MKFNIEIDIDWIDDESKLDDEVNDRIISGLATKIENQLSDDIGKQLAQRAESLIKAKTEMLISTILEKPVSISDGWKHKKEYSSIYDMVEQRMTALYEGKLGDSNSCSKDPLLGQIEKYVDVTVQRLLMDVTKKIEHHAAKSAVAAVNDNKLIGAISAVIDDK